jgi:hypothetical protein
MQNKSESLNNKIEKSDFRVWIPVYGVFQYLSDTVNNKKTPGTIASATEILTEIMAIPYKASGIDQYLQILFPQF